MSWLKEKTLTNSRWNMMHKIIVCVSCEAEFTIRHDMDDNHYRVEYCPFCGETMEDDEDYEYEINDEDEE